MLKSTPVAANDDDDDGDGDGDAVVVDAVAPHAGFLWVVASTALGNRLSDGAKRGEKPHNTRLSREKKNKSKN